jgi:hypothetical protein
MELSSTGTILPALFSPTTSVKTHCVECFLELGYELPQASNANGPIRFVARILDMTVLLQTADGVELLFSGRDFSNKLSLVLLSAWWHL